MTKQIVLRAPPSVNRRKPLLDGQDISSRGTTRPSSGRTTRIGEVAGGTAAECAAVCCCCPCGLVDLLILAVYKVPAGLYRKAIRRNRRRRLKKQALLTPRKCGCDESELQIHPVSSSPLTMVNAAAAAESTDKEVVALENEMWDKFYSAGFWRSPSQKSDVKSAL